MIGDLLAARQYVTDAQRAHVRWEYLDQPLDLSDQETSVAAGLVEMFALRAGCPPPLWTKNVGAVDDPLVLDPGLDKMPRSFARAKAAGPEPLRKRNLIASPGFLDVA